MTVELPDELIQQVQTVASHTRRSFDEVLAEWARLAGSESVLEFLSDEDLLVTCDSQLDAPLQEALSELLERNQEGELDGVERRRLDDLMRAYRAGLVRKAQALKLAVNRGLRPRLS